MLKFIKNIFNKDATPTFVNVETAPLAEDQLRSVTKETISINPQHFLVGCGQSVGRQRDHNEDTLYWFNATFANGVSDIPLGLFIVADGMGGHQHGEVASSSAARALGEHIFRKLYSSVFGSSQEMPSESIHEIMEAGIKAAQNAVITKAPGGGTTLTAALILGEQVTIGHVGDSRMYFIYPDGRMETMTKDHSLVKRLIDLGQITEEEAKNHPNKNVLYRALGQAEPFKPDIQTTPVPKPGYILLCSDGLWGLVDDEEMFRIITSNENLSIACAALVDAANLAGGPDNITAVLIKLI